MPNANFFGLIPYASQTWSIGAEEQFYLIWPVLNKKISRKWLLMISVIFIYLIIKTVNLFLVNNVYVNIYKNFFDKAPIHCMAIGGLFAMIVYDNKPIIVFLRTILFNKFFQYLTLFSTFFLIFNGFNIGFFHYEFYSILFGIIIINFASNPNRIFSMEYQVLNYLGKISYGLYMFHPIVIVFLIKLFQLLNWQLNYILYPFIFIMIIMISSFSYEYFEKIFINKKVKYSDIISGDNAK